MTTYPEQAQILTPKLWVGGDVSKADFKVAWRSEGLGSVELKHLRKMPVKRYERSLEGVKSFVDWLDCHKTPLQVVVEASGTYTQQLVGWIKSLRPQLEVSIVNPKRIKHYGKEHGIRNKTDKIDARLIACFGSERHPVAYHSLDQSQTDLRALSRARQTIVETIQSLENNSRDVYLDEVSAQTRKLIEQTNQRSIAKLNDQLQELDERIEQLLAQNSSLKHDVDQLDLIKGVGPVVALGVLLEMGDLRRFHSVRQAASFAGVVPKLHESGKTSWRPQMSKEGPRRVRRLLYMAVMAATSPRAKENPFKTYYTKLLERGKIKKAAQGVLMHKMLRVMRAVLISGSPYDPSFEKTKKQGHFAGSTREVS